MGGWIIVELKKGSRDYPRIVEEIVRLEKSLDEELRRNNSGLLYCLLDRDVSGYVMYSWPSSLCASITKLAVKEKYRRQGQGEALLKAAIEKCRERNIQCVSLHVDPSRAPAFNLYLKLGFKADSLIEDYYSHGRNAYRMFLDFGTN